MYYAPVIIPTLCRSEHLKKCMESLASNTWAENTEVYLGLDYPGKEAHQKGYEEICEYLEKTTFPFKSVNVIKRASNYGVTRNVEDLRDIVRQKYDRFIFTEDDNVFSENFLEYVDTMLEKIKDNDDVFGVCGYSYPVKYDNQKNLFNSFYVSSAFPAWGYGTFFSKRDKLIKEYNHKLLIDSVKKDNVSSQIRRLGNLFFSWYINRVCDKNISYNDIDIQIYQMLTGKVSVMPCKSLVRNRGWDGSGINCRTGTYDFSSQEIYHGEMTDNILAQDFDRELEIWKFIDNLNSVSATIIIKCYIKYMLVKLGIKR